jgi:hypothetical protein
MAAEQNSSHQRRELTTIGFDFGVIWEMSDYSLIEKLEVPMPANTITTRICIICGSDDYEEKFTYTYDFMKQVRGIPETSLSR